MAAPKVTFLVVVARLTIEPTPEIGINADVPIPSTSKTIVITKTIHQ